MAKYRLKVDVTDTRHRAEHVAGLVERQTSNLRSAVKDYLRNQSGRQDGDRVRVTVELTDSERTGLTGGRFYQEYAELRVSGVFAGQAFKFDSQHELSRQAGSETPDEGPTPEDQTEHEELFEALTEHALDGFEKAIGRKSTPIGRRWLLIKILIAGFSLFIVSALYYFMYTTDFFSNTKVMAAIGWMFGFGAYLIGYTIGAACMPLEFFEEHAEGHRVMGFVNTDDPVQARKMLRFGVVFFVGVALFMTWVWRTNFG